MSERSELTPCNINTIIRVYIIIKCVIISYIFVSYEDC